MTLAKKVLFSSFLLASILLAVMGYFSLKDTKKPSYEAIEYLPDSCVIYFSCSDFHELHTAMINQSLLFKKWTHMEAVKKLENVFTLYDTLINNNEEIIQILRHNKIHFALYNINNSIEWLLAFNLKERGQVTPFQNFINGFTGSDNGWRKHSKLNHFIRIENSTVLMSSCSSLIAEAKRNENNLSQNKSFSEFSENNITNNQLSFYYEREILDKNKELLQIVPTQIADAKQVYGSVRFEPNEWTISGNLNPDSSILHKLMNDIAPQKMLVGNFLPYATNKYKSISISSGRLFYKALEKNASKQLALFWNGINEKAMYNACAEFYDNCHSFITVFEWSGKRAVVIPFEDSVKCEESVKLLAHADTVHSNVYLLNNIKNSSQMFAGITDVSVKILYRGTNALYFLDKREELEDLVKYLNEGNTLSKKTTYHEYELQHLAEEAHLIYYLEPVNSRKEVNKALRFSEEQIEKGIQHFSNSSIMLKSKGGKTQFRSHINYQLPSSNSMKDILWQVQLDTTIVGKPFPFKNHYTGDNELIVQDINSQLYLIGPTGNIIWKKQINETIKSAVYKVDLFHNHKWQILFNSENYIHLIDRNGKYVQGYPVKLPAQATNEMSLIDYNNDNNERVFIACKNKKIYNYTLYGVLAEGYKPYQTSEEVKLPIKFIRVGQSDYLITIDNDGNIHAFSRKGDARIGFKNRTLEGIEDFELVSTNNVNSTYLCYVDVSNKLINKVTFNDKKIIVKLSESIGESKVRFINQNDDNVPDFVCYGGEGLKAFDVNGYRLYANENLKSSFAPVISVNGGLPTYYVYCNDEAQIQIGSLDGTRMRGLEGNSQVLIINLFNSEKKQLIYQSGNKLNCISIK
ncbi:MAG: hypothetical protein AB7O73_03110 [Bacteroidia bacterium]